MCRERALELFGWLGKEEERTSVTISQDLHPWRDEHQLFLRLWVWKDFRKPGEKPNKTWCGLLLLLSDWSHGKVRMPDWKSVEESCTTYVCVCFWGFFYRHFIHSEIFCEWVLFYRAVKKIIFTMAMLLQYFVSDITESLPPLHLHQFVDCTCAVWYVSDVCSSPFLFDTVDQCHSQLC